MSVGDTLGVPFDDIKAPIFTPTSGTVQAGEAVSLAQHTRARQSFLVMGSRTDEQSVVAWRILSPDGRAAAYRAGRGPQGPVKEFIPIADRVPDPGQQRDLRSGRVELIGPAVFSPDGLSIACPATREARFFVISGQTDGSQFGKDQEFDWGGDLVFSPDSKRLAYKASAKGGMIVIAGPMISTAFEAVLSPLEFSDDSHAVSFGVRQSDVLSWETLELP